MRWGDLRVGDLLMSDTRKEMVHMFILLSIDEDSLKWLDVRRNEVIVDHTTDFTLHDAMDGFYDVFRDGSVVER
jgi:hypothetical protein